MRLLRRRPRTGTRTTRPAERYVAAGAEEARRRGHGYVGTEHVLLALTRDPGGGAAKALGRLGVTHDEVADSAFLAGVWAPPIDPHALATLGIELDVVRERLEESFGDGALERTRAGMPPPPTSRIQCIAPRLKQALEIAVDRAAEGPVQEEHVLVGMLAVPDSLAARALAELGVSLEAAEAAAGLDRGPDAAEA